MQVVLAASIISKSGKGNLLKVELSVLFIGKTWMCMVLLLIIVP